MSAHDHSDALDRRELDKRIHDDELGDCDTCSGHGDIGPNLGCWFDATGDPWPYCRDCNGTGHAS